MNTETPALENENVETTSSEELSEETNSESVDASVKADDDGLAEEIVLAEQAAESLVKQIESVLNPVDHPVGTTVIVGFEGGGEHSNTIVVMGYFAMSSLVRYHVTDGGDEIGVYVSKVSDLKVLGIITMPEKPLSEYLDVIKVGDIVTYRLKDSDNAVRIGNIWGLDDKVVTIHPLVENTSPMVEVIDDVTIVSLVGNDNWPFSTILAPTAYQVGSTMEVEFVVSGVKEVVSVLRWGKDAGHQDEESVRLLIHSTGRDSWYPARSDSWCPTRSIKVLKDIAAEHPSIPKHPINSVLKVVIHSGSDIVGPVNVTVDGYITGRKSITLGLAKNGNLARQIRELFERTKEFKTRDVTVLRVENIGNGKPKKAAATNDQPVPAVKNDDLFFHIRELKRIAAAQGQTVEVVIK